MQAIKRKVWREADCRKLVGMLRKNMTISQIADNLKRTNQSITKKLWVLRKEGGDNPPPPYRFKHKEKLIETFLELYHQGKTDQEIGDALHIARKTVATWRHERNLPSHLPSGVCTREVMRRKMRKINGMARQHGYRSWGEYIRKKHLLREGLEWPGCNCGTEVRICKVLNRMDYPVGCVRICADLRQRFPGTACGIRGIRHRLNQLVDAGIVRRFQMNDNARKGELYVYELILKRPGLETEARP